MRAIDSSAVPSVMGAPATARRPKTSKLARLAWATLLYNAFVVLFGAVVRATGSGAGCGSHWPVCNGVVVPREPSTQTMIEYTHRLTSGLALVMVLVLLVAAFRGSKPGAPVRRYAIASVVFMVLEALLGAGLVLFELVAHDASLKRAMSMGLHLVNTFLLTGALTWTAAAATWKLAPRLRTRDEASTPAGDSPQTPAQSGARRKHFWSYLLGGATLMVMGITGAVAALGDTLFPASSLVQGLRDDLSPSAHVLLQLRTLHPFVAVGGAVLLVLLGERVYSTAPGAGRTTRFFCAAVFVQIAVGFTNLVMLVPLWLQLVHLSVAYTLIVLFAVVGARLLDTRAPALQ